jgi:hypothetical protein
MNLLYTNHCSIETTLHARCPLAPHQSGSGRIVGNPETDQPPKNQTQPDLRLGELRLGTEFRWKTFGVAIDSTMPEFVCRV